MPLVPPPPPPHGRRAEAWLLALTFVLVNLLGAWFQPQITKDGGKGWEGIAYYGMADGMARGLRPVAAEAPMIYRVGTPALAALLHHAGADGGDLFTAFRVVNLTANALALALLVAWLRRFVGDWRVRAALGLCWLLQWDTPTRWLWFYPAHADPWMWVFLLAGLLAVDTCRADGGGPTPARLARVAVLGAVGVLFREVVAVVPLALLFVNNPLRRAPVGGGRWQVQFPHPALALPLVVTLLVFLALRRGGFVRQTDDYAFARTVLHWLHAKRPWIYVHGWLAAFGPAVLALTLAGWRQGWAFLRGRQDLALYLAVFTVLGQVGGTDTERLLYWTMPVVFLLAGRALEANRAAVNGSPALVAALVLAQLLTTRALLWPIPDYPDPAANPHVLPLLTPIGPRVPYLDLFSFFAPRRIEFALLASNLAALGLLLAWLARRARREPVGKRLETGV